MMRDPYKEHDEFVNAVMNRKLKEGKTGTIYIPELLAKLGEYRSREERIKVLHANSSPALIELFRLCFHPEIDWDFSRSELDVLKIKKMDIGDYDLAPTNLFRIALKLKIFTNFKDVGNRMSKEKSLKLISEWFSALHDSDIEVIKQVVSGKFKFRGVSEKLIREAYPNLLPALAEDAPGKLPFSTMGVDLDDEDDEDDDQTPPEGTTEKPPEGTTEKPPEGTTDQQPSTSAGITTVETVVFGK